MRIGRSMISTPYISSTTSTPGFTRTVANPNPRDRFSSRSRATLTVLTLCPRSLKAQVRSDSLASKCKLPMKNVSSWLSDNLYLSQRTKAFLHVSEKNPSYPVGRVCYRPPRIYGHRPKGRQADPSFPTLKRSCSLASQSLPLRQSPTPQPSKKSQLLLCTSHGCLKKCQNNYSSKKILRTEKSSLIVA